MMRKVRTSPIQIVILQVILQSLTRTPKLLVTYLFSKSPILIRLNAKVKLRKRVMACITILKNSRIQFKTITCHASFKDP